MSTSARNILPTFGYLMVTRGLLTWDNFPHGLIGDFLPVMEYSGVDTAYHWFEYVFRQF